jgi:hypothetical protein
MNLSQYLKENFTGYNLSAPAFYQWNIGLRFELSSPDSYQFTGNNSDNYNELYFNEVNQRANKLFEAVFDNDDEILLIYQSGCWNRQRIKKYNYVFKQIKDIDHSKVEYRKIKNLYDPKWFCSKHNRAIIPLKTKSVNYKNIIKAISNQDFGDRNPNVMGEVFFVNTSKNLILNMYDDRGLDIIAKEKGTLEKIYKEYNDWILDYDREKIDSVFKK